MQDRYKTKQQLIEELASLRARLEPKQAGGGETISPGPGPMIPAEHYAIIFDKFPLGISVLRQDGFLIYINPAFTLLTGYSLPEIAREKEWFLKAFPDKEYRRQVLYGWVKYQTQQVEPEKVLQVTCKNEKKKAIEFNMITARDGTVISMLTEVTGREEKEELLREKEERWRLLLETMNEGFITVNECGIPVFANHRFCKMTGYKQEEIVGRPLSTLLDADNLSIFKLEFSRRPMGSSHPYELVMKCKDGRLLPLLMSPRPLYDSSGRFAGSFGTCMDITERKKMERALKESEEKLSLVIDSVPVLLAYVDTDLRFVYMNRAYADWYGLSKTDLIGKKICDLLNEEVFKRALPYYQLALRGQEVKFDNKAFDEAGRERFVSVSLVPHCREGMVDGFFASIADITARKHMEEALRESEERYRTIVESTNDAIYIHDFAGNIIDVNANACRMLGYERDELVGASLAKIDAAWRKPVNVDLEVLLKKEKNLFERENIRKDGSVIPVEVSVRVISREGEGIVNGFVRDISERKRVEEELRKRKEHLKSLANNLPGLIYQFFIRQNGEMGFYYVSERSLDILGMDNKLPIFFERAAACIPAEDRSRFLESIHHAARTLGNWEYEGRFITPRGEEKFIHAISTPDKRPGEIVFNGMVLDITEQRRVVEALAESRKRYQELIESISEIVWEMDATGRFTYVSPGIEEMTGYEQKEIVGKLPHEFVLFEDMEAFMKRFDASCGAHERFVAVGGVIVHKRGAHVAVEVSGNPFHGKEGRFGGYRGILRDVSEIRKLQEERLKSQKLESIGTLAGGVAHDFNNLLMGILGYIGLAKLNIRQEMVIERSLAKAEESCMRARDLTRRLLTFSRGGDPLMKPIDIREAIHDSVRLILGEANIQCRFYLAKHLHPILADELQIRQAIGNIVLNALEASPAGGSISIKGENIHYRRKEDKGFIKLTISDRGRGIAREYLGSIFDPYFTTKDMGALKGTGLGLSISYSIVKKHGGDITIQSEVGKGTSVSIFLPAYEDMGPGKSIIGEETPASRRPGADAKRILVMDDEELIRSFMADTISFLGYEVTTCEEGARAVEIYRDAMASRPYDLVILDLAIPDGWGGRETIRRLLDTDPAVTAVICSGYTDDPVISHYDAYGFKDAWIKPTSIDQIKATLESIFNKQPITSDTGA